MATTDRHGFLLWAAGFTQSDTILNDLLLKLEVKTGLSVISRITDAQPAAPAAGDCYIITATATGAQWAGFAANDVVIFRDSTWYAFTPITGLGTWVEDEAVFITWTGAEYSVNKGNAEEFSSDVAVVADQDYVLWWDAPWPGNVTMVRTITQSGSCTVTGSIGATPLGGTANAATTAAQEQVHGSANAFVKGDIVKFTVSANAAALNLSVIFYLERT